MAYTINKTNGGVFATVNDGTVDTSSSLTIIGKNYAGYGEFLGENFVKLLENHANNTAPTAPLDGQLWWDTGNTLLKVFNGSDWKNIGAATSSNSQPTDPVVGDLWWDSDDKQLYVCSSVTPTDVWTLVGPAFSAGTGTSGAIVDTISDGSVDHVVVKLFVDDDIVAIVSKDPTFTPATGVLGFATIKPGIQISTNVSNALFQGTATDSQLLDGIDSTGFISSTANDETTGTLKVKNDTGFYVGGDDDLHLSVSSSDAIISNATNNGDIIFKVNDNTVITNVLVLDGATSDVLPGVGGTTNIGSSGSKFNVIYANEFNGTATSAEYADLAERFESDYAYDAGTVVELGGVAEITKAVDELSENVFGVISTRAAYLMNATAGSNETHPAVAMNGRVPVKVIGTVNKGDRLVSAGNGYARSAGCGEATSFNVIGRALETKTTNEAGIVEAIVKVN